MSYIGIPPQANFSSGLLDRFTSTTGTTVTLTHDIASENDIVVFINFVKQDSTTYSVGGTGNKTLTLGGTLVSSDIVEVHYLNIVGQTNAPSSGSVGSSQLTTGAVTGTKLNTDVISAQTELASAPDSTDELLISDAGVLKRIDVSLVGGDNTPSFKAYLASNQTIGNDTFTKAALATEVWDTDSAWDTSNYKFTVPSGEGGKYVFTARFTFYYLANEDRFEARFYKNGSSFVGTTFRETGSTSSAAQQVDNSSTVVANLSAGDYIELYVKHNEGGNQTLYGPNNGATSLTGYKLIGV